MATADAPDHARVTLEYFASLPEDNRWKVEVVRGQLVREPRPAPLHNRALIRLGSLLEGYERAHPSEGVVLPETEFVLSLDPLTVRVPDLAWVSAGRIPANGYALPRWHLIMTGLERSHWGAAGRWWPYAARGCAARGRSSHVARMNSRQ